MRALGQMANESPAAVAALAKAIGEDAAADTRAAAAMALSSATPKAAATTVPALITAATTDESPHVRSASARHCQRIAPAAFRQVAERARTQGPVESKVTKRDGKIVYQGRSLDEWFERLVVSYVPNEIFGRPAPNEPLAAIRAIGPDAVPTLLKELQSDQGVRRQAAAAGLNALGPQSMAAIDPLLDIIATATIRDLSTANSAADAVSAIHKDQQGPPARLVELTKSNDAAVRLCAARAVAIMASDHPRGLPVLRAALDAANSTGDTPPFMLRDFDVKKPSVGWLGRVVADDDALATDRIQAAENLAQMGEAALPALPQLLQAVADDDRNVSRQATLAIQKLGSAAVPAAREALRSATDDQARQRIASVLLSLGNEGKQALQAIMPNQEAEPLWWAATTARWNKNDAMLFQWAARAALERAGQPVAAPRPQFGPNRPGALPGFEKSSVDWSVKLLADSETPRTRRMCASFDLRSATADELLPHLSILLETAIENAATEIARRNLLQALPWLGQEGQQKYAELLRTNPDYAKLFSRGATKPNSDRSKKQ